MNQTTLSIVIPCYNEEATLQICVDRVLAVVNDELALEIVIVDDCSSDNSLEIAKEIASRDKRIQVAAHEVNQGKGAALRTGFSKATGDIVAVQDADLEYNPMEFRELVKPIIEDRADVVFGSRYLKINDRRVLYFWHSLMNHCLTFFSNMYTDLGLTDMEPAIKFSREKLFSPSTSRKTVLASNRKSPRRLPRNVAVSMKWRSHIIQEPTKKVKRLTGKTVCGPFTVSCTIPGILLLHWFSSSLTSSSEPYHGWLISPLFPFALPLTWASLHLSRWPMFRPLWSTISYVFHYCSNIRPNGMRKRNCLSS